MYSVTACFRISGFFCTLIVIFLIPEIAGNTVCYEFITGNHSILCHSFVNVVQSETVVIRDD